MILDDFGRNNLIVGDGGMGKSPADQYHIAFIDVGDALHIIIVHMGVFQLVFVSAGNRAEIFQRL